MSNRSQSPLRRYHLGKGVTLAALVATQAIAADQSRPGHVHPHLKEIVVKGQKLDYVGLAWSSTHFDSDVLRELKIAEPEAIFERVPGMHVKDYGLSGVANAINIRGFGGGGHGGDLGVVLDGIPLNEAMSHADGYVDLNVIVPLEVDSLSVYKGPVSALYGNYNRGGLVKINTRKAGDYTDLDVSTGSDGLTDLQGALGTTFGSGQALNFAAQHYRYDGFRPQSEIARSTLAGRWSIPLTQATTLAVSGRWHDAEGDNAAYLSESQYRTDPYGIDPNALNDGSDKGFMTARADLSHSISPSLRWLTFAYATRQDFSRWFSRPVSGEWSQREETYDREVEGFGTNLNGENNWAGKAATWAAGIESVREATDYQYYEGLDQRIRTAPAVMDRGVELDAVSAFYEAHVDWHRWFMPSLGLRYDRFSGACRPVGPETGNNPCETLNTLDNLSPKLGFRSDLTEALQWRASWSEGFALPGGWLKYQSQAANLDPVIFRQIETGLTLKAGSAFELDLALYRLKSDGEIRTIAPGEYENYGATERTGFEVSLSWAPIDTLTLTGVYGQSDSEILKSDDASVIGNEVGGVAEHSATAALAWQMSPAWQFNLGWRGVGGYALNAANSEFASSYGLYETGVTYRYRPDSPWQAYVQIDNLTDEIYAASHSTIGYATGAPRQIRGGLQINF